MNKFRKELRLVAQELPLGLVKYLDTCTTAEEVREVLEIELVREYKKPLDWLYSVISNLAEMPNEYSIPTVFIGSDEYLYIEDGGILNPNTLKYIGEYITNDGKHVSAWRDTETKELIATPLK